MLGFGVVFFIVFVLWVVPSWFCTYCTKHCKCFHRFLRNIAFFAPQVYFTSFFTKNVICKQKKEVFYQQFPLTFKGIGWSRIVAQLWLYFPYLMLWNSLHMYPAWCWEIKAAFMMAFQYKNSKQQSFRKKHRLKAFC